MQTSDPPCLQQKNTKDSARITEMHSYITHFTNNRLLLFTQVFFIVVLHLPIQIFMDLEDLEKKYYKSVVLHK